MKKVTTKRQIAIPRNLPETLGIVIESEVDFREEKGRFYIVKTDKPSLNGKFKKLRGIATANMSTNAILYLTRDKK